MEKKDKVNKEDGIEEVIAPKSPKVKPYLNVNVPKFQILPNILGGVCEFCGESISTCKHYKGIDISCSYCLRNDKAILEERKLLVRLINEDELEICCDDFKCQDKFNKKYTPQV